LILINFEVSINPNLNAMQLKSEVLESVLNQEDSDDLKFIQEVLSDFWICCVSRETSLLGRREVLTGKAKFGILGDGKEVAQVAMARAFKKGDWRSGYYRDQTFIFALGLSSVEQFFAQLYADAENDPFSGGRQMNSHYATPNIDDEGNWLDQLEIYNNSTDVSSTGGQMGRSVGLALASKLYKQAPKDVQEKFSRNGDEVCFVTIGDASTSEGVFWEAINAAGVQKIPLAISVWDDGYGISVPIELQTTKASISKLLEGFHIDENGKGIYLYTAKGWDYPALCEMYERGINKVRKNHIPAVFHVQEVTQPQGHSTSGSHERYKSKERLTWETEHDCIEIMAKWILDNGIATEQALKDLRKEAKQYTRNAKTIAWSKYYDPIRQKFDRLLGIYSQLSKEVRSLKSISEIQVSLSAAVQPLLADIYSNARRLKSQLINAGEQIPVDLDRFILELKEIGDHRYHTNLYSDSKHSALKVPVVRPQYAEEAKAVNGYQILNAFFDYTLEHNDRVVAFGEDVGHIGDVNQGFAGLQEKYGVRRVFDTGIREWTIIGQAIGLAMRGWRPIAEIQYIDYLVYGLPALTDDLATLRYRSDGIQQAPAIIRTRGHRLEGIWHAGSPMGLLLSTLRGLYICVPRNMVQAAGMYHTLLQSDDPAIVVECLNGYRLKERMPINMGEFTVPLGMPEVIQQGNDATLVTYGSCVRIAHAAANQLLRAGISVEVIDVQTLLPFDLESMIVESLKKTNRLVILDEDIPGGASSFILQQILEKQKGYFHLDSAPICITAHEHRPPYGSDGDYFSKPNMEDVYEKIYEMMKEARPQDF
jgi:pyruvate/2-oxoglutarate/acetoin dehydrogenase E1 component/TPP-dependent pyruvate/acetoin dehydrogenase alpha subunit